MVEGRNANRMAHPGIKRPQLSGADLERFRRQVKRALEECEREAAVDGELADPRN